WRFINCPLRRPAIEDSYFIGVDPHAFFEPLPDVLQVAQSVLTRDDGRLPIAFHPGPACRCRRSGATSDPTSASIAAASIAIGPARFVNGLRDCARAARKYRE